MATRSSSEAPVESPVNALAMWDFRINAEGLAEDVLLKDLTKIAKHYCFQEELSDKGYLHYQGRLSLIKKRRRDQKHIVLNLLENKFNYFEPTANSSYYKGDMFYVMKEDTRSRGPWTDKDKKVEQYIPRQYRGLEKTLLPWQKQIFDGFGDFQNREINVIYDQLGNNGKSTCAHLARLHQECVVVPTINDFEKIVALVCCILRGKELRNAPAMFFDMPRAMGKERLYGFYSAIEQIKTGYVFDTRNVYKDWDFDSPQIWIFTNKEPELELQSRDRWLLWEIKDRELVKYVPECKIEIEEVLEEI